MTRGSVFGTGRLESPPYTGRLESPSYTHSWFISRGRRDGLPLVFLCAFVSLWFTSDKSAALVSKILLQDRLESPSYTHLWLPYG